MDDSVMEMLLDQVPTTANASAAMAMAAAAVHASAAKRKKPDVSNGDDHHLEKKSGKRDKGRKSNLDDSGEDDSKLIGALDEDDEDDMPLAGLVAKSVKNSGSRTGRGGGRRVKEPDVKKEESDSDDDAPLSSLTKKPASRAPARPAASRARAKPAASKKKAVLRDDDDDDEDEDSETNSETDEEYHSEEKPPPRRKRTKDASDSMIIPPMMSSKTPAKEPKKRGKAEPASKPESAKKEGEEKQPRKRKKKEDDATVFQWWNHDTDLPPGQKWRFLEHRGVTFPPPFVRDTTNAARFIYKGEVVDLPPAAEEVAYMYAAMANSDYMQKTKFKENFWRDWQAKLGPAANKIKDLQGCDFSQFIAKIEADREAGKVKAKEEKARAKELGLPDPKEAKEELYKHAIVDNHRELTGNFRVEPPGLFRGRGEHPKMGTLKRRICAEDISVNCSRDACPPRCPMAGHAWAQVVHNSESTWLACWQDSVNNESKYVWLSAASSLKGKADREKFEIARHLRNHIGKIRKTYAQGLKSNDQTATALWLIDNLALRVGNEKDTDEEADTVGCCSLRAEHVKVGRAEDGTPYFELDFLGKDSIRYHNRIGIENVRPEQRENFPLVCANLASLTAGKLPSSEVFDELTTAGLNKHVKTLVPGLKVTAKVFRTFNASITLVEQLETLSVEELSAMSDQNKLAFYNNCNFQVAKLCNHSRARPKNFQEQMSKVSEKIDGLRRQLAEEKKLEKTDVENRDRHRKKALSLEEAIAATQAKANSKELLSEVALNTSRVNYLDPRITVAWCKRTGLALSRIFNKSLMQKFTWAIEEADEKWHF